MTTIRVADRSSTIHEICTGGARTLMEAIRGAGIADVLSVVIAPGA